MAVFKTKNIIKSKFKLAIYHLSLFGLFFSLFFFSSDAHAFSFGDLFGGDEGVVELDDVTNNIRASISTLPGLITAISYLLALLLGITGILKLKEHVENPTQTPIRTPIIRFIIGGALLALPIIYEAMLVSIDGGERTDFDPSGNLGNSLSALLGNLLQEFSTGDLNNVLANIITSLSDTPLLISAVAYLIGLVSGVAGLLKIKEHVENPDQTPMREGVIRLIIGGALFGLPTVYQAMFDSIGDASLLGQITSLFGAASVFYSGYAIDVCLPTDAFLGTSLGQSICGIITHSGVFPAFLSAIAYLIGLILGFLGILKIRDHVLNPQQTQVWEGASRLIAGGIFFALPVMVEVARATVAPTVLSGFAFASVTGYNDGDIACGGDVSGLDVSLSCFTSDLIGPIHVVLNLFAIVAGMMLLMIGTSRLTKSAQEGAKGPAGLGTVMTFIAAGALISYNELLRAATQTLSFGSDDFFGILPITATYAIMSETYTNGMTEAELDHVYAVITAILQFMIMIGLVSFVRGIFIIRDVAEGSQQASLMAGLTHMIGGAVAVNLGPLINVVQVTLGITEYGIVFE